MKPYAYPRRRHERQLQPGPFTDYRRYKPALAQEFAGQCVYCRMPDGLGSQNFGVDHYRPKKRFPALIATYENLFYACNACNRRKSDFWPSAAQLDARHIVLNPCAHRMSAHVTYRGGEVVPRTPTGSFFSDLLRLNDRESLELREFMLRSIELQRRKWHETRGRLGKVKRALSQEKDPTRLIALKAVQVKLKAYLHVIEQDMKRLGVTSANE